MPAKVLTLGSFDLLHAGHLRLFERCAALGELHVGVNSTKFIRRYKTIEPAESEDDRVEAVAWHLLGEYGLQNTVYLNDGPGIKLIRKVKPDFLVVGDDWHGNAYCQQVGSSEEELFEKLGVSILYVPRTPGVSSGQLREQLRAAKT